MANNITTPTLFNEPVYLLGSGASKDSLFPIVNDLSSIPYLQNLQDLYNKVNPVPIKKPAVSKADRKICKRINKSGGGFEVLLNQLYRNNEKEEFQELLEFYQSVLFQAETCSGMVPIYCEQGPFQKNHQMAYGYGHYAFFGTLLKASSKSNTILTFNHDLLMEHGLKWKDFKYPIDNKNIGPLVPRNVSRFPFENQEKASNTIIKLHGSFNMMECQNCKRICWDTDNMWVHSKKIPCPECKEIVMPLYVPPLSEKDYKSFQDMWDEAKNALNKATLFVVIGYSFPDYDKEGQKLIFENLNPNSIVLVIDPYPNSIVERLKFLSNKSKYYFPISFREFIINLWGGPERIAKYDPQPMEYFARYILNNIISF